jgi:hypothetical protein
MINKDIEKYEKEKAKKNSEPVGSSQSNLEDQKPKDKIKTPIWFKITCGFFGFVVGIFINHDILKEDNELVWKITALIGWGVAGITYTAIIKNIKSNKS